MSIFDSGAQWGQVTTNVPVTIYSSPDASSSVIGTFMPGLIMVAASDPTQPWIQLQEAVIDYSQPDTAIVNTIGWVSQDEASAQGGAITQVSPAHLPPDQPPAWAGSGVLSSITGTLSSIGSALPSLPSFIILGVILLGVVMVKDVVPLPRSKR